MLVGIEEKQWPKQAKSYAEAVAAAQAEVTRLQSKAEELSLSAYQVYLGGVLAKSHGNPRFYNPRPRGMGFFGEQKRAVRMCEEMRARLESICQNQKAIAPAVRFANDIAGGRFDSEAELERAANSTIGELRETLAEHFDGAGGR